MVYIERGGEREKQQGGACMRTGAAPPHHQRPAALPCAAHCGAAHDASIGTVTLACRNAAPSPVADVTSSSALAGAPRHGAVSVTVCASLRFLSSSTRFGLLLLVCLVCR